MSRSWTQIKATIKELSNLEHGLRMRLTPIAIGWGKVSIEAIKAKHTIEDVAAEGNMPVEYIENCYNVVSGWGNYKLPEDIPFSVFEDLLKPIAQDKLAELGMTKEQLLEGVIAKRTMEGGRVRVDDVRRALGVGLARRPRRDKALTAAEDLMEDPKVADEIVNHLTDEAAVALAERLAGRLSAEDKVRAIKTWMDQDEVRGSITNDDAYALSSAIGDRDREVVERHTRYGNNLLGSDRWNAEHYITSATTNLKLALQELRDSNMGDQERQAMLARLDKLDLMAGWLRSRLTEGRSFDAELEALLSGEL
jgi:hypothetical protein